MSAHAKIFLNVLLGAHVAAQPPAQARLALEDRRRSLQDAPRNFGPEPCNFRRERRIFARGPFIFEQEPLIFEEEPFFFKNELLTFKEVPPCFANHEVASWKSKSRPGFSDHTSMFIAYGIHLDGREEGHVECFSLDDVFTHLREMIASEAADAAGSIFAAYGFRMARTTPPKAEDASVAESASGRPAALRLPGAARTRGELRRELMAHLPVCNTVLSEQSRQAILLAASQARARPRQKRTSGPACALRKCRTRHPPAC